MASPVIWTIGHSTRPIEDFLEMLTSHTIEGLADVRFIPYSRRHPQYNTHTLSISLQTAGLQYHSLRDLGGRRKTRPDSPNLGWRNASFRGYADYMQTPLFWEAIDAVIRIASTHPTAIMCAEALPWRCHRSLIADALTVRGWQVRHIMSRAEAKLHELTAFAMVDGDRIVYPAQAGHAPSRLL